MLFDEAGLAPGNGLSTTFGSALADAQRTPAQAIRRALVLMPCGATKQAVRAQAQQMYLGPMWQSYRAALGELDPEWRTAKLALAILSAEHGLLPAQVEIDPYERQMTAERLQVLQAGLVDQAKAIAAPVGQAFAVVVIAGGELYRELAAQVCEHLKAMGSLTPDVVILKVRGAIGIQRQGLKRVMKGLPDLLKLHGRPAPATEIRCAQRLLLEDIQWQALDHIKLPWKVSGMYLAPVLHWLAGQKGAREQFETRVNRLRAQRWAEFEALRFELEAALLLEEFTERAFPMAARRPTAKQREVLDAVDRLLEAIPDAGLVQAANALALRKRGGRFSGGAYVVLAFEAYRRPAEVLRALEEVQTQQRGTK